MRRSILVTQDWTERRGQKFMQRMQLSQVTFQNGRPPIIAIAPTGQCSTQRPHAVQVREAKRVLASPNRPTVTYAPRGDGRRRQRRR